MRARTFDRVLTGAESFDPAGDEPDPYGDAEHAVAARPAGWAPRRFDDRFARPRVALILIDGDRSTSAFAGFAAEPFPLAVLIGADAPASALSAIRAAGKTAYAACDGESVATVVRLRRGGAAGIACSTDDPARAAALVQANRGGVVFDDLVSGDALYRTARAARVHASTRDVFADARDDDAYVDFLFAQALEIARRTDVVTVTLHARPSSLRALDRFAVRAQRDGVDLVELGAIAR